MKAVYILAMLKINGVGPNTVLKQLKKNDFDLEKTKANIMSHHKVSDADYAQLLKISENEIIQNENLGIKITSILSDNFPQKLFRAKDPVLFLYYRGDISLLNKPIVTIIGSRKASKIGLKNAKESAKLFAQNDVVVLSGLAIGCDAFAHEGCLEANGKTIAVLPSDVLNVQPNINRDLSEKILNKGGCLISEYPYGSAVSKFNYPKRDKIQAILADVVLVVEASEESGTMIAVKAALKEKKVVYQLSGNVNTLIDKKINLPTNLETILETILEENNRQKHVKLSEQIKLF